MFFDVLPYPFRDVDQVGEAGGTFPGFTVLREDERQDGGEFRGTEIVAQVVVPDADHVGEQPQSDEGVFLVLMLEKDIKKGGVAVDFCGKKEVARGGSEFGVDETAAEQAQRGPIHAADEIAREVGLEKGAGVVGVRKGRLDQLVVGLVKRTLWQRHKRECCKQPSWRQREEYDGFDKLPLGDARGDLVKSWTVKSFFGGMGALPRGAFFECRWGCHSSLFHG